MTNTSRNSNWTLANVRRALRHTLGVRHEWNHPVTVNNDLDTMRLIAATDAARRAGLALITIFPKGTAVTDGPFLLDGEPTFAIANPTTGALLPLSDAAEDWFDATPSPNDGEGILVDAEDMLTLLSPDGWINHDIPVRVSDADTLTEPRTVRNIVELVTVHGTSADAASVHFAHGGDIFLLEHAGQD